MNKENKPKRIGVEEPDITEEDDRILDISIEKAWKKIKAYEEQLKIEREKNEERIQNMPQSLISLLKIEGKSSDLHQEFFRIAKKLFANYTILKDGGHSYRFTEIEFYFFSTFHKDIYIYRKPMQLTSGKWFKHGSGVDLTFGNSDANIYGGILIRGLWDIKNERYINGCWNVLKELSDGNTKISNEALQIKIQIEESSNEIDIILSSTRVGLIIKDSDADDFISRQYRFITDICPKNKFKEKTKVAKKAFETKVLDKEAINGLFTWEILK
ncbi:MAG: hypothetical protein NTU98_07955 [Bacteroidetes bacterium]|nr:hypothetical protein [Bacteroidota bacterium]